MGGASAEEHRDVTADVVQAIVTCVDVLVIAEAGQRDEDDDEGGGVMTPVYQGA